MKSKDERILEKIDEQDFHKVRKFDVQPGVW